MRILLYFLTAILGALGLASVLRFVEVVALGSESPGSPFVGLIMGMVFLLLAWKSFARARQGSSTA